MKERILTICFITIIFGIAVLSICLPDNKISFSERRKLTTTTNLKEDFLAKMDDYLSDQMPLRNFFLNINNSLKRFVLGDRSHNQVLLESDYLIEELYPLDTKSLDNFINKINNISEKYLINNKKALIVIPDKNYYVKEKHSLKIDYSKMFEPLQEKINFTNVDVTNLFKLTDFYKTDIHLKQEAYFKVLPKLASYYNFDFQNITYQKNTFSNFKGSSYSKVPFQKPESLNYYTNDILNNALTYHLEYPTTLVYNESELQSIDAYNVFLNGPSSFITIQNNAQNNNRELVIFRDSFGSSLAPLLISYYQKITLIDLRYINMDNVLKHIEFNNQDILFMYSTLSINNSHLLK